MKWRQKGKRGLTIPYLIGAMRIVEKREIEIVDLLNEIDSEGTGGYFIRPCADLSSDIVVRSSEVSTMVGNQHVIDFGQGNVAVHPLTLESAEKGHSVSSSIFEGLGKMYEPQISKGLYSAHRLTGREDASYTPFSGDELVEPKKLHLEYKTEF